MSSNNQNQYDYQEEQAEANARSARKKGRNVLDKGAQQLEDYTTQLEATAGQAVASMGQNRMFTYGGPQGSQMSHYGGGSQYGVTQAETNPYDIAAGVDRESATRWQDLGDELSQTQDRVSSLQSQIDRLRQQRAQARERLQNDGDTSSSSRDVSVRDKKSTPGNRDPNEADSTRTTDDGSTVRTYESDDDGDDGLSDAERERLENEIAEYEEEISSLEEEVSPLQEEVSNIESQREEISSQYEGDGDFEDAISRGEDIANQWGRAVSEAGDTELDVPQQLRAATGSNLLNLGRMTATLERDRSKIINQAMTAADTAFFDAQQQNEAADYMSQLADEQRQAEQAQNIISGITGAASLIGGTILTGGIGVAAAPAAGIGMMTSGAGTLGSSFM